MQLAIVFWFYRDVAVCTNRVRLLRRRNPDVPVFGLYGGPLGEFEVFRSAVGSMVDDLWAFPEDREPAWKWRNGDLVLTRWFVDRGASLGWESIFVAQWDMVVGAPLSRVLPPMAGGDMLLSGLRPVSEVETWWRWTRWSETQEEYQSFVAHVERHFGQVPEPLCCQFLGAVLPRSFLERYSQVEEPELGFLEYKLPIYAQAFGIHLLPDTCFRPFWAEEPRSSAPRRSEQLLHAWPTPLRLPVIVAHMRRPGGARIFHPYHGIYPHDLRSLREMWSWRRDGQRRVAPASTPSMSSASRSSERRPSTA